MTPTEQIRAFVDEALQHHEPSATTGAGQMLRVCECPDCLRARLRGAEMALSKMTEDRDSDGQDTTDLHAINFRLQARAEAAEAQLREIAKDCGKPDTCHPHSAVRVRLGELSSQVQELWFALNEARRLLRAWITPLGGMGTNILTETRGKTPHELRRIDALLARIPGQEPKP